MMVYDCSWVYPAYNLHSSHNNLKLEISGMQVQMQAAKNQKISTMGFALALINKFDFLKHVLDIKKKLVNFYKN
jgi:hypothetical protein